MAVYEAPGTFHWNSMEYDITKEIEATTTSTTSSLSEVEWSKVETVCNKHNRCTGHVDTQRQCTSCYHHSEVPFAEETLNTRGNPVSQNISEINRKERPTIPSTAVIARYDELPHLASSLQ